LNALVLTLPKHSRFCKFEKSTFGECFALNAKSTNDGFFRDAFVSFILFFFNEKKI